MPTSQRPSITLPAATNPPPIFATPRLAKRGSFKKGQTCGSFENIDIEIGKPLGGGSQGDIFDAIIFYSIDGIEQTYECVAKRLKSKNETATTADSLPTEMQIHQRISDTINLPSAQSGLLRIIGVYEDEDQNQTYALLPRCTATLKNVVEHIESMRTSEQDLYQHILFKLFSSMLDGLTHLSSMGLSHGDLKPDNIGLLEIITGYSQQGLQKKHRFCMLDFGSVIQPEVGLACSPAYMSPELCTGSKPNIQSDIWAVAKIFRGLQGEDVTEGCTIPEQIFLKRGQLYTSAKSAESQVTSNKLRKKFKKTQNAALIATVKDAPSFSDALTHLINAMSETLPEKRPSIRALQCARDHLATLLPVINKREENKLEHYLIHGMPSQKLTLSRAQTFESLVADVTDSLADMVEPFEAVRARNTDDLERTPDCVKATLPTPKATPEKLDDKALAAAAGLNGADGEPRTTMHPTPRTVTKQAYAASSRRGGLFGLPSDEPTCRKLSDGNPLSRTAPSHPGSVPKLERNF